MWNRLPRGHHQVMQKLEFLWSQMNRASTLRHPVFHRVQLELAMANRCVPIGILSISSAYCRAQSRRQLPHLKRLRDYSVKIVKRNEQHLFRVLPKRWIVERTFAWLNWSRRLSKDYELRHTSAETMIHIAF